MPNGTLNNFAAGETSPRSRGRFDLEWFKASCEKLLNWVPEVTGPARYRSGFKHVRLTRGGATALLIPFQYNASKTYMLEFTAGKMRAYLNGDLIATTRTTLTAATKASPCVITVASTTGLADGDEVLITGVVGMLELNNRQVKLANKSGSTYQLVDPVTGANIDSTAWGTWSSGGTVREVDEITSPYLASEFDDLSFAPSAVNGVMYFAHPNRPPQKLVLGAGDIFTLGTFSRTADPFGVASAVLSLSHVYRSGETYPAWNEPVPAGVTIVTFASGVPVAGTLYDFAAVVGTTEINGNTYAISSVLGGGIPPYPESYAITIVNASTGADIDSSGWTAYTSGGTATPHVENPIAVAFYEGRLGFFGTGQRPNSVFLSMGPDGNGNPRYENFTGGTTADDACFFALAPANGQVDYISWARGTPKYLFVGTYGGPFRLSGSGLDEPITPGSIDAKQFDGFGCEATPPVGSSRVFWIQRGGVALRTAYYDPQVDELVTRDMTLNAEHIAESRLTRAVFQSGRPDVIWVRRSDGVLAGMTVSGPENVAGWHRQKLGDGGEVLSMAAGARSDRDDQLWVVARRTVAGVERCAVEIMADAPTFPDREDFYTGPDNADADEARYRNAVWRRQEEYIHLDSAVTYDGSDRGTAAGATLTPSALTGEDVALVASEAVFLAGDVGKELWVKPDRDTGEGAGRATITAYVSPAQVTVDIDVDFESLDAVAAGDWYFATDTLYGVWNLEGAAEVAVVGDGAVVSDGGLSDEEFPQVSIERGTAILPQKVAVAHIGIPYEGVLKTHNLELSNGQGPAQAKPRNIVAAFVRFLGTLGVEFGTDIYDLQKVEWRTSKDKTDRPSPVFAGIKEITVKDGWSEPGATKHVFVRQRLPLPAVVQFIEGRYETSEGGA